VFVFYDTETTGLDIEFCQILQIALVFTDDDLNILSSKKLECRRSPWIVPSPGALFITGFNPDNLKFNKLSHYEMMQDVNKWLRGQHWPITFIGYNSIAFDEPLLAQNFYQNLINPKLTTAKNKFNNETNKRADVMTLVKAVSLYMPGALNLDKTNYYGNPSANLVDVAKQNGVSLPEGQAHDAMNDIKATIGVAKVVQKAAPEIWEHMMSLSTADGVNSFLKNNIIFTAVNTSRYKEKTVANIMTSLFISKKKNEEIIYNLEIDPTPYINMSVDELKNLMVSSSKDNPFISLKKQNQPILMPMDMSDTVLKESYIRDTYVRRRKKIISNEDFIEKLKIASVMADKIKANRSKVKKYHVEQKIDNKLTATAKKKLVVWASEFHSANNWQDKKDLIDDFYIRFENDIKQDPSLTRFVKFAGRIVFEHAPKKLSAEKQGDMNKYIAMRLLNPNLNAPYMTVAKARRELAQIERERLKSKSRWGKVTDRQIRSLKLYYTSMEKEFTPYLVKKPTVINDNGKASCKPSRVSKKFNGPKP